MFKLFLSFLFCLTLPLLSGCDSAEPKIQVGSKTGQTEDSSSVSAPSVEAQGAEDIAKYERLEIPFIEIDHRNGIQSVAFSRDGKKIVTASSFGRNAQIFDAYTGAELHKLEGHTAKVNSADFSPDGRKVVTVSGNIGFNIPNDDRSVRIWDAQTGKELKKMVVPSSHPAINDAIYSAAFSPDGKKILTVSQDKVARIWDAESGTELRKIGEFGSNPNAVNYAVFSRDGKRILTGCGEFISGGGRNIMVGSEPGSAVIWDAETGRELQRMEGHTRKVEFVAFSQDEKKVVTVSTGDKDQTVRIWDVAAGKELQKLQVIVTGRDAYDPAPLVAFSPDGKKIITKRTTWDTETGKELHTWKVSVGGGQGDVRSVIFSPGGRVVLTTHGDCARIWDAGTGAELKKLGGWTLPGRAGDSHLARFAAFSPDGKKIVTAESGDMSHNRIRIWTLE
jgi:WD40 repeat protein